MLSFSYAVVFLHNQDPEHAVESSVVFSFFVLIFLRLKVRHLFGEQSRVLSVGCAPSFPQEATLLGELLFRQVGWSGHGGISFLFGRM